MVAFGITIKVAPSLNPDFLIRSDLDLAHLSALRSGIYQDFLPKK